MANNVKKRNSLFSKFAGAYTLICLLLSSGAYAIPVAFEFNPGDASLSGSFKFDFATETYSEINITGVAATYRWGPTHEEYSPVYGYTPWLVWEGENWAGRILAISWLDVPVLTMNGGAYSSFESLGCSGPICSGRLWEGTVSPVSIVSVPVPASLTLVLCGLTILALIRRKPLPVKPPGSALQSTQ
jgi:hypothetical protein